MPGWSLVSKFSAIVDTTVARKRKMLATEDRNEGLHYTVKFTKILLTIVGGWPLPSKSGIREKISLRIQNTFAYLLFLSTIVPGLLRMILIEKSTLGKLRLLAPIMNCSIQMFKYTILLYFSNELRNTIDSIGDHWENSSEEDREILWSKARIARKVVLMSAITMYGGGLAYRTIGPISRGTIVTAENATIRPLAVPVYLVFIDEQATPIYEIVFVVQFFSGFATYAVVSGSCGMCAFLVLHVCSLLKILANRITRLIEQENQDEKIVKHKIAHVVTYQVEIDEFLAKVEMIAQFICLVETVGALFFICIQGYNILVDFRNTISVLVNATILYALTFSLFMLCYISQLLDDESSNVGQTSSTLDWYRLPKNQARSMVPIIITSNSPKMLTAGKMVNMSLATFTDIMKMSMAYLNMLREVI